MKRFIEHNPHERLPLPAVGKQRASVHEFDAPSIAAVNAALAANRPLLLRGEPGIGKSQLARAAAVALGRAFISHVVDARTESRDLLYHYDAVTRLAHAQVLGALKKAPKEVNAELQMEKFLRPGALWWAFDWEDAKKRLGGAEYVLDDAQAKAGWVVLIDEIDKGEPDVPNGLLEALGSGCFQPPGYRTVTIEGELPLVIITTNEERSLPTAFLRRCLSLTMSVPELPRQRAEFELYLVNRGEAHFGDELTKPVYEAAARLTTDDRIAAKNIARYPLPGQAQYIDILRALRELDQTEEARLARLGKIAGFFLGSPSTELGVPGPAGE
ncbi:MAG: MoxR family ATPase [Pseudomonadota bacterium]